jgi:hypothetical protein
MAGHRLRLGVLAKNPPGRAWFSARAAVCLAGPVGWSCGDTKAGLLATLSGFTALYGSDRPYVSRAGHLAVVALGFAAAIALGDWAAALPWLAVLTVSAVAMVATLLCTALAVGPPELPAPCGPARCRSCLTRCRCTALSSWPRCATH